MDIARLALEVSPLSYVYTGLEIVLLAACALAGPLVYLYQVRKLINEQKKPARNDASAKGTEDAHGGHPGDQVTESAGSGDASVTDSAATAAEIAPNKVHPVLQDMLANPRSLEPENVGWGMVNRFAACAIHAAATDGSVKVRWTGTGRPPMGRDIDPLSADGVVSYSPGGPVSKYDNLFQKIEIVRVHKPKDPIDSLVIDLFSSYGTHRLSTTLHTMVYQIRSDWASLSERFKNLRIALAEEAARQGLRDPIAVKRLKFLKGWALAIALISSPLLVNSLPFQLLLPLSIQSVRMGVKAELLPSSVQMASVLVCLIAALVISLWARFQLPSPRSMVTARGKVAAEEPGRVLHDYVSNGASASQVSRMSEEEQLRLACYMVLRGADSPEAIELASRLGERAEDDTWQRAFFLLCGALPVKTEGNKRKGIAPGVKQSNAISLCSDVFSTIEIDERDDGADM